MAAGANCIPLVQKVQRLYTKDMVIETVPSEEGLCKKRSSAASRVGDYGKRSRSSPTASAGLQHQDGASGGECVEQRA